MSLFVLTVSLSALGLPVVADNVVVIAKKRILTSDAFPPIINLYKVKSLTNVSGIVTASLDPDDATVYHEIEIYDILGVKIYSRVFTMPPQAVALTSLPVQDIITASAATAVAASVTATAQAVIATTQAGISTAQAVIATTKASEAAVSAASIRVDSATYAAIPALTTSCFVFVAADETNDNLPTVYFFDGSGLQWLPSVGV